MAPPSVQPDAAAPAVGAKKAPARKKAAATAIKKSSSSAKGLPLREADSVGSPASKRELRSQGRRTMRKLLDAAMVAFDTRGYHATRVNDVVEIAKTSHGTFYLYFSNKEDLLRALVSEAATEAQQLYEALKTSPELGGSPQWSDVRGWINAFSILWIRYAPLFRVWTDLATIDPDLIEVLRQTFSVISDALTMQIGPDSSGHIVDPEAAGMAALAMLDRFHYLREFAGQPVDDVAIDTLTTMVYRALFDTTL
jgi:AcrR family transcriptional regulator